jgi:hypothetical protein
MRHLRKALLLVSAFLWANYAWTASVSVNPAQYAPGGWTTMVWAGTAPCVKSSSPAYARWDQEPGANGGFSVAPETTTVFTLACADGTATATLTVGNAPPVVPPPAPTVRPAPAPCYPDITIPVKVATVDVDPAEFNGETQLSLWTCRTATGYINVRFAWNPNVLARWFRSASSGSLNEAEATEWCRANCWIPTAQQSQRMRAILAPFEARAVVSTNGASLTRPVYPLLANGTRGTTAVAGVRATVGSPCDITKRVGTTSYYAVTGGVALCTFTAPAGVNE